MASGWCLEQTLLFQNEMICVGCPTVKWTKNLKKEKISWEIKRCIAYFKSFFPVFVDHKEWYMKFMVKMYWKTDAYLKYDGKNYKDIYH